MNKKLSFLKEKLTTWTCRATIETIKNPGIFTPFCDGKLTFDSVEISSDGLVVSLKSKTGQEINIGIIETVFINDETDNSLSCTFVICDLDTPEDYKDYLSVDFCNVNV